MPKTQKPADASAEAVVATQITIDQAALDAVAGVEAAAALVEQQAAEQARAEAEAVRQAAEDAQAEVDATALAEKEAAAQAATAPLADILSSFGDGVEAASREWIGWAQARALNRAAGFTALMQCRSAPDLLSLHGRLVREEVELLLATGARVCDISVAAATRAASAVSAH